MDILKIARMCHATNRNWCREHGDHTQPRWHEAPQWQIESTVKAVEFHLANPDASMSASHDAWCKDRLAAGWTYGPVKDTETKQHPCLVPFDDLPIEQQIKDRLFKAIVHAIAGA